MDKTRHHCITRKVPTDFGSMYIHIALDDKFRPVGGCISTPGKEPESQIHKLVETLSEGLNEALHVAGEEKDGGEDGRNP